jgi:site-specific recombinase XerD
VRGTAPVRNPPILSATVRAMAVALPETLAGLRDRAVILLAFAGAFRRSELIAVDLQDLQETEEGLLIRIRRSKGDQESTGIVIAVPYGNDLCPITALRGWLQGAGITTGPVFRSMMRGGRVSKARLTGRSVATIIKQCAARAGLDPRTISPHGLRAGLLTEAASRGASIPKLLEISRHRQIETLRPYLRPVDLFAGHAAIGLL